VDTGGIGANVRSGPGTGYGVVGGVAEGQSVTVSCQQYGTTVNGNNVWDYLSGQGGYVSDFYVLTGYDGRHPGLPLCGSTPPPSGVRDGIVAIASAEVGNGHLSKYGGDPSWEWCALFSTWVWRQAGVGIPNYAFTGDVFTWGQARGLAVWDSSGLRRGDVVLYGWGPSDPRTSTHIGVVVQVNSNGTIVTVEGNWNNRVSRVGPFDPRNPSAGGWQLPETGPVYGYVRPPGG
jgi:hypothetical protein